MEAEKHITQKEFKVSEEEDSRLFAEMPEIDFSGAMTGKTYRWDALVEKQPPGSLQLEVFQFLELIANDYKDQNGQPMCMEWLSEESQRLMDRLQKWSIAIVNEEVPSGS